MKNPISNIVIKLSIIIIILSAIAYQKIGSSDTLLPFYIFLWIVCLLTFGYLHKGIRTKNVS